ncbi:VSP [Giardia lamblia P15]|uniref:VSP n=1 Tax=Giardia intestinalis (strain P15) TaxID=658858 RepID=E1EXF3_GIAIA|nr:VSP [Giardia lamblia P15]
MLLIALLFVSSTLAADCQPDGDHAATCQTGRCETVGSSEICTQCRAGGAPIDGFCRPVGSPQVITAGCTKGDGTALEQTAATCEKCGSEYFLFMGGCYRTESQPGSEICTAAEGGKCTACKTDSGLFKNPAVTVSLGSECVLCSDTTERDGITGVKDCAQCTHTSTSGAATCTTCKAGAFSKGTTCEKCSNSCLTCETEATRCTSCPEGKYLKATTCVDISGCDGATYADPESQTCKECNTITDCTACKYNATVSKPQCTACGSGKKVKTAIDGATTCVTVASECVDDYHFKADNDAECTLCSNTTAGSTANDKGIANCNKCAKANSGQTPKCSECENGFFFDRSSCTKKCADNCATCSAETAEDKCLTCKAGFFLVEATKPAGRCIPCDSTQNGGISGCAECTGTAGSLKCTQCKPDHAPIELGCQRSCEDVTGCGGTAGACDAAVVDGSGNTKHYCSFCGESSKFPIDGICTDTQGSNTGCTNHICSYCAQGYFLYMGGCYSTATPPGNLMCKTANSGICTEAASDKYFAVSGAAKTDQSVLACGNPLGTAVGEKTYVGVEGCSQCTAPAQLEASGMASATCTACGEGKKPNKSGTGCAVCSVENCRHCRVDGVCEECSSGFSLEGGKCISTGTSGGNRSGLSTGAIAGIAVAVVVVVVGGLVGFLCWWFICRGKA